LSERALARLSGAVAIAVGATTAVSFGAGAYAARQLRVSTTAAVVVAPEARLADEQGRPLRASRGKEDTTLAPEGATVYVREQRDGRCLVEWGSADGWLSAGDLRLLPQR
jgi:hypothetical protein